MLRYGRKSPFDAQNGISAAPAPELRRFRNKHRNGNGGGRVTEGDELQLRPVTDGHRLDEEILHAAP
jgi:hypothetical protein